MLFSEIYVRIMKQQPMLPRYVTTGEFGIRTNIMNVSYTHKSQDYEITITTNNKGIRSPSDTQYNNPLNNYRILLLGDSFGMGYGVEYENMFINQAAFALQECLQDPVEIINLSVSGFSSAEQLITLKTEGIKYKPDIVISTWHETDLQENIRSGLFKLSGDHLKRTNNSYLPGMKEREFLFSIPGFSFIAENSQFYNFIREKLAERVKEILFQQKDTSSNLAWPENKNVMMQRLALRIIMEIDNTSKQIGAQHFMLNIPSKKKRGEYYNTLPQMIDGKLEIINVLDEVTFGSKSELMYWENAHGHFTPAGTKIVGESIYKHIRSSITSICN